MLLKYNYEFNDKNKKKKSRIIFITMIIIIAVVIASFFFRNSQIFAIKAASNVIRAPFKFIGNSVSGVFSSVSMYFGNINDVKTDNIELKEQVKELELKLLESKAVLDENSSLKTLLDINTTFQHFKLRNGKIIVREHDNFSQTFIIDVGLKDGIKLNQPVIHKEGLVGYISSVSDNTSNVTTILDPRTSVSVTISTINEPAILKGNLELKSNNSLKLEYIPIDAEISIGDMLYSSGLGSMFPTSLPVGKVTKVVNSKNDSDRYAIAEPCVNIRSISEVSVIIE
jgi:rod shape-determining protein MreC